MLVVMLCHNYLCVLGRSTKSVHCLVPGSHLSCIKCVPEPMLHAIIQTSYIKLMETHKTRLWGILRVYLSNVYVSVLLSNIYRTGDDKEKPYIHLPAAQRLSFQLDCTSN